ncbi:MAG TPA: hypothetical protein PLJ78_06840 [Anaerolineae bacterium]|nr:hypothetical protein [Anaerolineae bacterium]HQK13643.1 hypothetical protein [Anaerolineae bacterium]
MSDRPFCNPYSDFTVVRNILFDQVMPSLSSDAWKVLCVALRQTWGGDIETGRAIPIHITLTQFEEKTGIKAPGALGRALRECVDAGYLLLDQSGDPMTDFVLNLRCEIKPLVPGAEAAEKLPPLRPGLESAFQALVSFAREMGAVPDLTLVRRAVVENGADAVADWIAVGRVMTHLEPPARFKTVLERLLQGVPPLPLSMLAPEELEETPEGTAPASTEERALSAAELWEATLNELRTKMRSSKFKFFESTVGIALEDGVLTVEAPNERIREWLETGQLAETTRETFKALTKGMVTLKFVARSE